MTGLEVILSIEQARECWRRAALRKRASRNQGRDPSWSVDRDLDQEMLQEYGGQCGELAVELAYGLRGSGSVNTFHGADLVGGYQVRQANEHHKRLIVRDDDRERLIPAAVYVFVTGLPLRMWVRGWVRGSEIPALAAWEDPHGRRPCMFVAVDQLHPPQGLPRPV